MKTLQVLFISGNWNEEGGRSSKYMSILSEFITKKITGHVDVYNGGTISELKNILEEKAKDSEVVFWFPNIPTEFKTEVPNPKDYNPACTLINYRRNDNNKLSYNDLRSLAIASKADITCEVFKDDTGRYQMRIFDANDTIISDFTPSTGKSVTDLISRIYILRSLAYSKMANTGEQIELKNSNFTDIVDKFIDFGNYLANQSANPFIKRHLGEIAFRGAIDALNKSKDILFVSSRHVRLEDLTYDKESEESINKLKSKFTAVRLLTNRINYYGELKPCFNSSTYVRILTHLPKVNYIFFCNNYVDEAKYTEKVLPSHCIQQVQEIRNILESMNLEEDFAINLLGCGSLIFLSELDQLDKYFEKFIQRELPETVIPEYDQVVNEDGKESFINTLKDRPLINGELLDIQFDDGSSSVYKVAVRTYQDNLGKLHQEATIKLRVKGVQTELPVIGLNARRV